jgi:hypothetical protein
VTNGDHIGPKVTPGWWDFTRQLAIFCLGVSLIIYAVITPNHGIRILITGLILIGMIPIENFLGGWHLQRDRPQKTDAPT